MISHKVNVRATHRDRNLNCMTSLLKTSHCLLNWNNRSRSIFRFWKCSALSQRGLCSSQFNHIHQLPQEVENNRLSPAWPLTECRPLEYTHTDTTCLPKMPCRIIGGRRRVMHPGDRRDYANVVQDSFHFRHAGQKFWHFWKSFSNCLSMHNIYIGWY